MSRKLELLLIRADAGPGIGGGHFMRCLALGQEWKSRGGDVLFLTCCRNEWLRGKVISSRIQIVEIDEPHPAVSDLKSTLSVLNDLKNTAGQPRVTWLVLDGYCFDEEYQKAIRAEGTRLLVIDDIAHLGHYHADMLLNQNVGADALNYSCDPECRMLLGPQYALIRQEFLFRHNRIRTIPEIARKVLVTLGASDPDNVTLKVVHALSLVDVSDLEVKIVVGPANRHLSALTEATEQAHRNIKIVSEVSDMAELMEWADVAVSAAGSTCWELSFMGLPSVLVVLAENQCGIAEGLSKLGVCTTLGLHSGMTEEKIAQALTEMIRSREMRLSMGRKAEQLVDGCGASRVCLQLTVWTSRKPKS